jgi:hypothetical protein
MKLKITGVAGILLILMLSSCAPYAIPGANPNQRHKDCIAGCKGLKGQARANCNRDCNREHQQQKRFY